jgi:hypothetical protein
MGCAAVLTLRNHYIILHRVRGTLLHKYIDNRINGLVQRCTSESLDNILHGPPQNLISPQQQYRFLIH